MFNTEQTTTTTDGSRQWPAKTWTGDLPAPRPQADGLGAALLQPLLDAIDLGLLVLGPQAEVLLANRAARRWCTAQAPLQLEGRRLQITPTREDDALVTALARARLGRRTMVTLRRPGAVDTIGVVPLAAGNQVCSATLLVLGSRGQPSPLSLEFFCQTHHITPAESAVLSALCQGMTPAQAAERAGVQMATVRSQITAIREKTHTNNLAHLLRQVAALPPLAGANGSAA